MKVIVITGSTRGIGYGLADEFLKQGCAVVISGRAAAAVESAAGRLAASHDPQRVLGLPCDVTQFEQIQALWAAAVQRFGRVDVWINNAGLAHPDIPFWEQPPDVLRSVVETNLTGMLYGCKVALLGLAAQPGGGAVYNFEGFGSNGRARVGLGLYGSTKAAVRFFTRAVRLDAHDLPVKIGTISPGMVTTDMLVGQYGGRPAAWQSAKRVFNILAERVETVAPFIVERVLRGELTIVWLTPGKVFLRFLTAPFNKRDLFAPQPEA